MIQRPETAYKEWSPVVAWLAAGRSVLLLRKGGIAEGRGGFQPQHGWFWLFPTTFHPAPDRLKPGVPEPSLDPRLRHAARLVDWKWIGDAAALQRLDPLHAWTAGEAAKRFHGGDRPGLHALIVRVWTAHEPLPLPAGPAASGCRSWIPVEASGEFAGTPVLDEEEFARRADEVRAAW